MIHHTIKLALLLTLTLISCNENKDTPAPPQTLDSINYSMEKSAAFILENPEIRSVSIGVYKDGETSTGYYGSIDKGENNPATDETLFEIASVTKSFTGLLTAQAVLDGKLTVEDDIRTYLDGSYPNLEYQNRPIKIKDLLTHTSGIRRDFSETLGTMFSLDATQEEKDALKNYRKDKLYEDLGTFKLDTLPGARYDYSPIVGPELLANILEKVYKTPYAELLQTFILDKANMEHTAIDLDEKQRANLTNAYTDNGQLVALCPVPMTGAGYAIKSTIPDLTNYIKYILESDDPVIKEMQKPLFYDEEDDDQYGYFWQVTDGELKHNGGTNGSTNWVIIMPQYNAGFTVMFNTNGKTSGRLINRIANFLYDDIEFYPKKNPYFEVRKEILKNTPQGISFFKTLKKEKSTQFNFDDTYPLNSIGYELLRKDRPEDAVQVFKLLVSEFPNNANAYDSLGEGFYKNEQYDLAITNYKKSLSLNPENNNAQKMIEEITALQAE